MLLVNDTLQAEGVVQAYKQPCFVERAFRSYKPIDLEVRPIHRRLVCMLGYYVEWHMRKASAPESFSDGDNPQGAKAQPSSIVAPRTAFGIGPSKASVKRTKEDLPVHSFQTLC